LRYHTAMSHFRRLAGVIGVSLLATVAVAAGFAGFSIKPYGDQSLDLTTGITTLSKGGVISDSEKGFTVDAKWLRFKEGDFVEIKEGKIKYLTTGILNTTSAHYDLKNNHFTAQGDLMYSDALIKNLQAKDADLDSEKQILVIKQGVSSSDPKILADRLMVDYLSKVAVLQGNYTYTYKGSKLSGKGDKAMLWVTWNDKNELKASTKPTPEQLKPYLSLLK
jgi:hypothetical protein